MSMPLVATRCTRRSYTQGPGGLDTSAGSQMNVGCAVSITTPAGLLNVTSVAQDGTFTGPISPVVAVSPLAAVASTRQNRFPALKAWLGANVWAVIAASTSGFVSELSRLTRRWYVMGVAN